MNDITLFVSLKDLIVLSLIAICVVAWIVLVVASWVSRRWPRRRK